MIQPENDAASQTTHAEEIHSTDMDIQEVVDYICGKVEE